MRDRQFVWTWWAGTVPDYFGTRSVFHVARFGVLRIRRACGASSAGKPVGGDDDARAPFELCFCSNRAQLVQDSGLEVVHA